MKFSKLLVLAMACTWSLGAMAQWQWLDKDGRKVFSDRPPPQEIPEKNILKQPGGMRPAPVAALPASSAESPSTPVASKPANTASAASGKDKELEEKKAQAEAEETAKKKAEEEKAAKTRADNCQRAQQAKAAFDSGRPLTQTNAQGERIFLDEKSRASEAKRINSIIASECKR